MKRQKIISIFFVMASVVTVFSYNNCGDINLKKVPSQPSTPQNNPPTVESVYSPAILPGTTAWGNRNGMVCGNTTDRCDSSYLDANGNLLITPSMAVDFWLAENQVGVMALPQNYTMGRIESTGSHFYWPQSYITISFSNTPGDFSGPCSASDLTIPESVDLRWNATSACANPKYFNIKWRRSSGAVGDTCNQAGNPYIPRCAVSFYYRNIF